MGTSRLWRFGPGRVRRWTLAAAVAAALTAAAVAAGAGGSEPDRIFVANSLRSGPAEYSFSFGGTGDTTVVGDFDGDGADDFASRVGRSVEMVDATGIPLGAVSYGTASDGIFLAGDWNGSGTDGFAIVRGNTVFQRDTPTNGPATNVFSLGRAGDEYLAGDFDGDGIDTIAVRRGTTIYQRNSNTSGPAHVVLGYGAGGDRIVFGDFDGDGIDTPAAQRGNVVFVRNSNTTGTADRRVSIGRLGDLAVAGDFDGDGVDTISVIRDPNRSTTDDPGKGTIVIKVSAHQATTGPFRFTGDLGQFGLATGQAREMTARAGTYDVVQGHPFRSPGGLVLSDLRCQDSDRRGAMTTVELGDRTATIRLDDGERVVCRFVNGPPNILLLLSDDQGYTDYGFMGNEIVLTPNLDRLAGESTVFRHGFTSSPLCTPSHVSLLTGLEWLQFTQRSREIRRPNVDRLPLMEPVAGLLVDAGYASFVGGKWWFGDPADSGFSAVGSGVDDFGRDSVASLFDFLDDHRREPWYAYVAPALPHSPWDAPQEIVDRYDGAVLSEETRQFYANITRFDDRVGEILGYLDDNDLRESTLIVFTTDNGFQQGPLDPGVKWGGEHGKLSPYELGFRTPVLFSLPGVIPAGTGAGLVAMADLYPTTLSFAGVPVPAGRIGDDLTDALTGAGRVGRESIVGMTPIIRSPGTAESSPEKVFYYRDDRWRYIWWEASGHEELYAIADDPLELDDVVRRHPVLAERFRTEIQAWIGGLNVSPAAFANPEMPPCVAAEEAV